MPIVGDRRYGVVAPRVSGSETEVSEGVGSLEGDVEQYDKAGGNGCIVEPSSASFESKLSSSAAASL